jgi:hypothetical protein
MERERARRRMSKAWVQFEYRIAKLFGGRRRGRYAEGNDIADVPGFSIECKLNKRPSYGLMFDACKQAEGDKENELDIAIAIVKKRGKGIPDNDALVIMRLEEYKKHFV